MFLDKLYMSFLNSQADMQQQKEFEKKVKNSDEYLRRRMYQDIHSIKGWVKFFGVFAVISLIIGGISILITIFGTLAALGSSASTINY